MGSCRNQRIRKVGEFLIFTTYNVIKLIKTVINFKSQIESSLCMHHY